jgi:hypothetical protein
MTTDYAVHSDLLVHWTGKETAPHLARPRGVAKCHPTNAPPKPSMAAFKRAIRKG